MADSIRAKSTNETPPTTASDGHRIMKQGRQYLVAYEILGETGCTFHHSHRIQYLYSKYLGAFLIPVSDEGIILAYHLFEPRMKPSTVMPHCVAPRYLSLSSNSSTSFRLGIAFAHQMAELAFHPNTLVPEWCDIIRPQ